MYISEKTRKAIEIDRVMQDINVLSPYGAKKKKDMQTYTDMEKLNKDLQTQEDFLTIMEKQKPILLNLRNSLRQLKDLQKIVVAAKDGVILSTVEFFELKIFAGLVQSISNIEDMLLWETPKQYKTNKLAWLEELLDPDHTGIKTFYIYDGYSEKLKNIRKRKLAIEKELNDLKRKHINGLEQELGIKFKITGEVQVSKKDEVLVQTLKANNSLQITGETYITINFKIRLTEDMLKAEMNIESIKTEEILEENDILEKLSIEIGAHSDELLSQMDAIGELDLLIGKCSYALAHNCSKPLVRDGDYSIMQGRHPIVAENLRKLKKEYEPIDIKLNKGVTLITGANMGGKTVSLKLAGLLLAMVHYGIFVPAQRLEAPILDHITIVAGDDQNIDAGLSTFGAEMLAIKEIVETRDNKGLILIDEIARGTNPQEGYAISASIINNLMQKEDMTLITTHYDGLVRGGIRHLQVKGLRNIDFSTLQSKDKISDYMDYSLIEITDNQQVPRDAINIARLMELPAEIISYAEKIIERGDKK